MLRRLKVKNFKSLKNFEVELGKFNVLVGRNNSGKSNILDVLSFLNEGVKESAEKTFNKRGGYKEVVFGGDTASNIEINAVFEAEFYEDMFLFDYYLKFPAGRNITCPVEEILEIQKNNGERERFPKSSVEPILYLFGRRRDVNPVNLITGNIEEIKKEVEETERTVIVEYKMGIKGSFFYTLLQKICAYKIIPHDIKQQYPVAFVEENIKLDNDCKNLALFLLSLSQQNKRTFERITELLCGVVDEIEDVSPQVLGKNVYLKIKDRNFDKYFYPDSMSDGTISLLSYITIIETADKHNIICFEEPENYIHARILDFIVDLMKKSNAQIIVATHSLSFIDLCNPEDIIIVEKEKGETTAKRIKNPEKLKEKLGEIGITLGESYFSGEFKNL